MQVVQSTRLRSATPQLTIGSSSRRASAAGRLHARRSQLAPLAALSPAPAASAAAVAATFGITQSAAAASAMTAVAQAVLLAMLRETAAATWLAAGAVACGVAFAAAGDGAVISPVSRTGRQNGIVVACQTLWTWQLVWLLSSCFVPVRISVVHADCD